MFLSLISLAILPEEIRSTLTAKLADMRAQSCLVAFDSNYPPVLWPDVAQARLGCSQMWAATSLALPSERSSAFPNP